MTLIVPLSSIDYVVRNTRLVLLLLIADLTSHLKDHPTITFNSKVSVEMPFRAYSYIRTYPVDLTCATLILSLFLIATQGTFDVMGSPYYRRTCGTSTGARASNCDICSDVFDCSLSCRNHDQQALIELIQNTLH